MSDSDDFDFSQYAGEGFDPNFKTTPRDCANVLLDQVRLDMQLSAIRSLLRRNRAEDARLSVEIEQAERHAASLDGMANVFAVEEYGELFYEIVYQDGTHALAAVAMIAPLIESTLVSLFRYVLMMCAPKEPLHERWSVPDSNPKKWNCKFRWIDKEARFGDDILGGIDQIAKMVDITRALSDEDRARLRALIAYRNYMFHNGIEWPADRLAEFEKLVAGWPAGWFNSATSGHKPWMYYMTEAFADGCLDMLDRFLDGVGSIFMEWNERTAQSFDDIMKGEPRARWSAPTSA